MASKASQSETLAWRAREAQARRVACMLSPRDAQLAEAYAAECEDHAREAAVGSVRLGRSASLQRVSKPVLKSVGHVSPKQVLFCGSRGPED
jgi:hypothetical protein